MSAAYRVIDANLNRAKEGLRVVEDICRFVLENPNLTDKIKTIRHGLHKLVNIPDYLLVQSREAASDVGQKRPVPRRQNIRQILTANIKRAAEAIRVLEEFLPKGTQLKDQRYQLYELEKNIWQELRRALPFEKDIYVVGSDVKILSRAVTDGAAIIQLRDKQATEQELYQKGLQLANMKKNQDFLLMINDCPKIALRCGADGVHVGQDQDIKAVRKIVGKNFIIGKTTHNLEQGKKAKAEGANYISVGPIYATPTKPGRPAVGLEYIREAKKHLPIPFVTIGGIDLKNVDKVLAAGAQTIGIVRAAAQTKKILAKIRSYYAN